MWPLQELDGSTSVIDGLTWWFFLASPKLIDPELRHDHARIRLVTHGAEGWVDRDFVLPAQFGPGSREWSGSCVRSDDGKSVTLYFTAAGDLSGGPRFQQRMFFTVGTLNVAAHALLDWSPPEELFVADGGLYAVADEMQRTDGMIDGFRDPSYFRDPRDGSEYIVFTGTRAACSEMADGVIGAAYRSNDGWTLLPPLIDAVGVSKELERPHIVEKNGLYYLFWSTPKGRFATDIHGRTALYGMVAESMLGPWRPVNRSGLIAGNPDAEPHQAYAWLVTKELDVLSFANYPELKDRNLDGNLELARDCFAGTVAPAFRLYLDGDRATFTMSGAYT
jgi:levansucrase